MDYAIKQVTDESTLDRVLAFAGVMFPNAEQISTGEYAREKWVKRMQEHSDLMLYAEADGNIVGIVFGRIEENGNVTVGPVAVDGSFGKRGIGREMMLLLEKHAMYRNVPIMVLGSVEGAEGFYKKCGYTVLPEYTEQTVFIKHIGDGSYGKHAMLWDWGGHDRSPDHEYWMGYALKYGKNVLIPFCATGESAAYMAERGLNVTAVDITPEMIDEGRKRFGHIEGIRFVNADVRGFQLDIEPVDFCYMVDMGHLHTIDDVKKVLSVINAHMRNGAGLVIEIGLPSKTTEYYPPETFIPMKQVYPGKKVWKVGDTKIDAESRRTYISQTIFVEDENGKIEQFDHSFYLQAYKREELIGALTECGFEIVHEYKNREKEQWDGEGFWIVEAIKQ